MANTILQLRKSGETGNVPPSLAYGELALNYADGKLFYKAANGTITYIQSGGGGSGSSSNSFATINVNSSLILATSPTDTLSFVAGNNVTISTNTTTKTITINAAVPAGSDPGPAFDRANSSYAAQNTTAIFANAAYTHANAAYAKANTGTTTLDVNSDIVAFTIAFS
jgi:hypothetical protein